jgi:hypothetical protein
MDKLVLIMISILMITLLIGVIVAVWIYKKRKQYGVPQEVNYQAFFTMGISFIALGIVMTSAVNIGFIGFLGLGIAYLAIGLANKDKWEKKE